MRGLGRGESDFNKVGDHALRLSGMLHLAQEFDLNAARAGNWRPSDTIAVAVITVATHSPQKRRVVHYPPDLNLQPSKPEKRKLCV